MATFDIEINRRFQTDAAFDAVWALLSDTPRCIAHYPKLQRLVPLGESRYRWELTPIGAKGFSHQVVYAADYRQQRETGRVEWTPVPRIGNAQIRGHWQLEDQGGTTAVTLHTTGEVEIPVPLLLRGLAKPFVKQEFDRHIERFVGSIQRELEAAA